MVFVASAMVRMEMKVCDMCLRRFYGITQDPMVSFNSYNKKKICVECFIKLQKKDKEIQKDIIGDWAE